MKLHNTLQVEYTGGAEIGRCYWAYHYKVRSFNRQLDQSDLDALFDMGALGSGQEFTWKYVGTEAHDAHNNYHVYTIRTTCDSSD